MSLELLAISSCEMGREALYDQSQRLELGFTPHSPQWRFKWKSAALTVALTTAATLLGVYCLLTLPSSVRSSTWIQTNYISSLRAPPVRRSLSSDQQNQA